MATPQPNPPSQVEPRLPLPPSQEWDCGSRTASSVRKVRGGRERAGRRGGTGGGVAGGGRFARGLVIDLIPKPAAAAAAAVGLRLGLLCAVLSEEAASGSTQPAAQFGNDRAGT